MINFFRKTRKKLAVDNKFFKYSRYAIGEILLVMVGILLAFQVSTWNTNRLRVEKERELLTNLMENLQINKDQLKAQIRLDSQSVSSSKILLKTIKNKMPYSDSLDFHFNQPRKIYPLTLTFSAYTTLENYGFEIIRSKSLRREIIKLFDDTYPDIINIVDNMNRDIFGPSIEPYFIIHFELVEQDDLKPNNYDFLLQDPQLVNRLAFIKNIRQWHIELRLECLNSVQDLMDAIEYELSLN